MSLAVCGLIGCGSDTPTSPAPDVASDPPSTIQHVLPQAPLPLSAPVVAAGDRASADDWFETIDTSGMTAYQNGLEAGYYTLLESVGGGVALLDYDRDGWLDLYFTGGGRFTGDQPVVEPVRCGLFRHGSAASWSDASALSGVDNPGFYSHGCSAVDFDNDGFADILVTGYGGCRLYHNCGDGTFEDVTDPAGLNCPDWNVHGVWADMNRDGCSDLYLVTYSEWSPDGERLCRNGRGERDVCGPARFSGIPDHIFLSNGSGGFDDVSSSMGLVSEGNRGLAVVAQDLNGDGWPDFYVANDVAANHLYMSNADGMLEELGNLTGTAWSPAGESQGSMGVDIGDYNRDGRPDIWYANYMGEDNSLLRNVSEFVFVDETASTRQSGVSRPWVGFGTIMSDFDRSGWPDIFVANGHVQYHGDSDYFQPAQLFANDQGSRFEDISSRGGTYFSVPHAGRGVAVGDLDNDGAEDLVVVHQNAAPALLRNRVTRSDWLSIQLVGTVSSRDGIGARLECQYQGKPLTRWVQSGRGYLSSSDLRLHLPADSEMPSAVTVTWPSGKREEWSELETNRQHVLVEGTGRVLSGSGRGYESQ